MFERVDTNGRKTIASIIFYTIQHDVISAQMLIDQFKISATLANSCLDAMDEMGVVDKADIDDKNISWNVIVYEPDHLAPEVLELLISSGYSAEKLSKAFQGLETKEYSSNILTDKTHSWVRVTSELPELNKPVVIRIVDPVRSYMETRTTIVPVEDIKIAAYDGFKWTILPPYPKYDYSPLSDRGDIKADAQVSHWAPVTEAELHGWKTRFDPIGKYKKLFIEVDPVTEEEVYRSLILAAACIMKESQGYPDGDPTKNKLLKAHSVMCDLQSVMDIGVELSNMEGDDKDAVDKKES